MVTRHLTARNLLNQRTSAIQSSQDARWICAARKAVGGIGLQTMAAGRAAHAVHREMGRFNEQSLRLIVHSGILSANDTSDTNRTLRIANRELIPVQFQLSSIKRFKFFAMRRTVN